MNLEDRGKLTLIKMCRKKNIDTRVSCYYEDPLNDDKTYTRKYTREAYKNELIDKLGK